MLGERGPLRIWWIRRSWRSWFRPVSRATDRGCHRQASSRSDEGRTATETSVGEHMFDASRCGGTCGEPDRALRRHRHAPQPGHGDCGDPKARPRRPMAHDTEKQRLCAGSRGWRRSERALPEDPSEKQRIAAASRRSRPGRRRRRRPQGPEGPEGTEGPESPEGPRSPARPTPRIPSPGGTRHRRRRFAPTRTAGSAARRASRPRAIGRSSATDGTPVGRWSRSA